MDFTSTILIVPGLGNSKEDHWQSLWEKHFNFARIHQKDWETPNREDWVETLDAAVIKHNPENLILVGHSLACITIAFWAAKYKRSIKGALLVAPSDTETPFFPKGTTGFTPIPHQKLPFSSILVASSDDPYMALERAESLALHWGSRFLSIGAAGHINKEAGFGAWPQGLEFLKELDTP
ncbi:RBBP9/YdeN family alpha/beta hydrolase [Rufibacter latericius]|uniref:Alpha/beta hydrolase n=1 Tax=Rufibacter latericius TaxID=2487040 RepID=A0A3M9N0Z9_9BACT|nr:alpha/beta hydrolase [Rufibacter latericius]RNI30698.1 alpha/beta hydrolase [Rufibacter latericius]